MSREIKFRAWDGDLKRMFVDGEPMPDLCIDLTGKTFAIDPGFAIYEVNKLELMQFTGLKDRNGVDIYEGDIVTKFCMETQGPGGYKKGDPIVIAPVSYRKSICAFTIHLGLSFKLSDEASLEVIGNIHQDKQLLD